MNVEPWLRKANLELLEIVGEIRPEIILVIGTEGVRAGTLGQLRSQVPNALIYCLFPDTPHNLVPDRIQCLPIYDRVMTVSPGWIDAFERLGGKQTSLLPLAADPDLHPAVKAQVLNHDLAFIGNWRGGARYSLRPCPRYRYGGP